MHMRYQFHWKNEAGDAKEFNTSAPDIGEVFMRATSDFPHLPQDIKDQFDQLYADQGSFEKLLEDAAKNAAVTEVQSGIRGLIIRCLRD